MKALWGGGFLVGMFVLVAVLYAIGQAIKSNESCQYDRRQETTEIVRAVEEICQGEPDGSTEPKMPRCNRYEIMAASCEVLLPRLMFVSGIKLLGDAIATIADNLGSFVTKREFTRNWLFFDVIAKP
ncbi:MAG: hypothetical protein HZC29_06900, partial [Thaumarchaeota archaeon]|nr:hypothetical protein [Nitrososphaerota archaeon]